MAEAEALGIVDTHADETKATGGNIEITAVGAADDVWTATIIPAGQSAITLGTYTEATSDTTILIATGLFNAINALTSTHGFTATNAVASNVAIVAPAKYGASINTSGLTGTSSGTGTATITQFTSGVGSVIAINHYHISEFFALAEKINGLAQGILYIGLYTSYDSTTIPLVQEFADGDIRCIFAKYVCFQYGNCIANCGQYLRSPKHTFIDIVDSGFQCYDLSCFGGHEGIEQ